MSDQNCFKTKEKKMCIFKSRQKQKIHPTEMETQKTTFNSEYCMFFFFLFQNRVPAPKYSGDASKLLFRQNLNCAAYVSAVS